MTDLMINYLVVNVLCAIALIVMAYLSWNNVLLIAKMKKHFSFAALTVTTVIVAEIGSVIFENFGPEYRMPAIIVNIIGFSLSPFIGIVLSEAFFVENGRIRSLLTIPVWIDFILVLSSPWTGYIFSINAHNSYLRGPLFGVYVYAYVCSYAILLLGVIKSMKHYQCHGKSGFIMLLIFTVIGTTIQLILPEVHVAWLCITLSLIMFYAYFCTLTQTQDTLTGLLNRNVYDQYTKRLKKCVNGIVIVFDLDDFKQINDIYGHHWGDYCLQITGRLIKDCFYKIGFCYRIGGDEFCVICKTTDEKQARDTLRRFHRIVDESRKDKKLHGEMPMISTGYAIFHGSDEYNEAVKKADEQMYSFKNYRKQKLQVTGTRETGHGDVSTGHGDVSSVSGHGDVSSVSGHGDVSSVL